MPTMTLPSKPDAVLAYELLPGDAASSLLVVFLNGLGLPQSVWQPTIELFQQQSSVSPKPWLLTYDRYGQGSSSRDPRESWPSKDPGYAHTLDEVTDDLHELIQTLSRDRQSRIVFVNNSIGAQVARRYADRHPTIVEGILFLDSNPGNTNYDSIWPNPKDPSFNLEQMMCTIFSGNAKNAEGFDRRDIKDMLPDPSSPKLKGSKTSADKGPWVTVVGHELEQFSQEEWTMLKVPIGMAAMYTQPMWHKYNEGLGRLTDPDRAKGPLIAPKSGHFIQKDNPAFVAKELQDLIEKVEASA
ncbi:alpha/beta-hydrolase [Apiospora phragmitis]|uniref:Alpha/beta-hydrolase n=1 Tax=Apiospora phragmitis TaxID=2905665 RepID=A0ABR1VEM4_9PEZI